MKPGSVGVISQCCTDSGSFKVSKVWFADVELIHGRRGTLFGRRVFDVVEIVEEDIYSIPKCPSLHGGLKVSSLHFLSRMFPSCPEGVEL